MNFWKELLNLRLLYSCAMRRGLWKKEMLTTLHVKECLCHAMRLHDFAARHLLPVWACKPFLL